MTLIKPTACTMGTLGRDAGSGGKGAGATASSARAVRTLEPQASAKSTAASVGRRRTSDDAITAGA
jgi:hypothetical protein